MGTHIKTLLAVTGFTTTLLFIANPMVAMADAGDKEFGFRGSHNSTGLCIASVDVVPLVGRLSTGQQFSIETDAGSEVLVFGGVGGRTKLGSFLVLT